MIILIMGPQGSGKSTQAKLLAADLNLPFISAGELVRQVAKNQTEVGQKLKKQSEKGELVDDDDLNVIMAERFSQSDCVSGFVLDGYPRRKPQLDGLNDYLRITFKKIDKVFYLDLPDEEGISRLLARGRVDDTVDVIRKRLEVFHQETSPIINYFKDQNILEVIDGRPSIEEIHKDIANRSDISDHVACQVKS